MIYESETFNFDGKDSSEFGIRNVSVSGGMYNEPFVANRMIQETKIRGKDDPYFHGVKYDPLTFNLTFAFESQYSSQSIRDIATWLCQSHYKPLYFSENTDRIFYCIVEGDTQLIHNGLKQGYVTLNIRCNSPYSYSPIFNSAEYDMSANIAEGTVISFDNDGDVICKPEIWITKIGAGDVKIVNESNNDLNFEFTGLVDNEIVYVNSEREYITTNIPDTYRYDNFNNNYLEMITKVNNLRIYGNCKISFQYQFKLLQG